MLVLVTQPLSIPLAMTSNSHVVKIVKINFDTSWMLTHIQCTTNWQYVQEHYRNNPLCRPVCIIYITVKHGRGQQNEMKLKLTFNLYQSWPFFLYHVKTYLICRLFVSSNVVCRLCPSKALYMVFMESNDGCLPDFLDYWRFRPMRYSK